MLSAKAEIATLRSAHFVISCLRSRRLEVVGARKNGRARGRHARGDRARRCENEGKGNTKGKGKGKDGGGGGGEGKGKGDC